MQPSLITRYLLKNLLTAGLFIAAALTMVIWLTQSLKLLEIVTGANAPTGIFLKLVLLTLPRFLEIILPLALVAAILFVYNKMVMDNELVVMRAAGFDQRALSRPALMLAGGLCVVLMLMTTWLSPRCYAEMQALRQNIKTQYSSFLLREGVFNTFSDNMTVYLRARAADGDLLGLMIHDTRDKEKPPVTVIAKRGRVVMEGDVPNILVFDGMRQQMDRQSGVISKLYFSRYTIEIKGLSEGAATRWKEASERTLPELLNPDMTNRKDRANRDVFRAEAHRRVLMPFNAIGFSLVALCCVLLGPFNRRGQGRKILLASALVVGWQAADLMLANAAKAAPALIPAMYLLTLAPVALGFAALGQRGEQWLMARLDAWQRAAA